MPQRFLRPGIRNSERWNSVSDRSGNFYIRLITLVDDFGRCDGRPSVLLGECFSVWNEKHPNDPVNLQQVAQMLQELSADSVQLIELYEVDGKKVLQITQWQERIRDSAKERWPANPQESAGFRRIPQESAAGSDCVSDCKSTPAGKRRIPQDSAGKRSVSLPPSSPSPSPPSPAYTPTPAREVVTPTPPPTPPPPKPNGVCVSAPKSIGDQKQDFQSSNRLEWLKGELCTLYRRPKTQRSSYAEEQALSEVSRRPDVKTELQAIKAFKAQIEPRFFPQSLARLLEQWEATLDKARNYQRPKTERTILDKECDRMMREIEKL